MTTEAEKTALLTLQASVAQALKEAGHTGQFVLIFERQGGATALLGTLPIEKTAELMNVVRDHIDAGALGSENLVPAHGRH